MFRDFSQIFDKSKRLTVHLHPCSAPLAPTPLRLRIPLEILIFAAIT